MKALLITIIVRRIIYRTLLCIKVTTTTVTTVAPITQAAIVHLTQAIVVLILLAAIAQAMIVVAVTIAEVLQAVGEIGKNKNKHIKMKKLLTLSFILISLSVISQKKDSVSIKYDTVQNGLEVIIRMDTTSYKILRDIIGSIPPNQSKYAGFLYNLLDGSQNNIIIQPLYGLKPKKK